MQRRLLSLLCLVTIIVMVAGCAGTQPAPAPAAEPTKAAAPAAEATKEPAAAAPTAAPAAEATKAPEAAAPTAAPAAGEKHYFEALALTNLPYFIDHRVGQEFAGKVLNAKTKFVGPVDYDMTAMVNTMEQAAAENPTGMNIIGFDPALKPAIDTLVDNGVPVVTLDAEVYGCKRMTFLGTGNFNAGVVGGRLLAELLGGKGKVALITKVGQSNLEERIAGYKSVFEK